MQSAACFPRLASVAQGWRRSFRHRPDRFREMSPTGNRSRPLFIETTGKFVQAEIMSKFRAAAPTLLLAGALTLTACAHHVRYFAGVSVGPPPPLAYGPVGVAPYPGWVWIDGYYDWSGSRWMWRPGRWARPPHRGYVWRGPSYERYRSGYRMRPGHWARR